ncbi:MAG: galactokinase [Candidatus Taylorbacteria bacterium]|nr:galactokinase [Candidatus Taylorbacteria bacterium]
MSKIIISRVPFRLSLGGGSTDLPSYYEKHGGFIFGVTINLYMDVFVKEPRSDDNIHVHYKHFESVSCVHEISHEIVKQTLLMQGVKNKIAISFKADTPAGTGLGSSGACAVAVMKGVAAFHGKKMTNTQAATNAFKLTRALKLPDGVQDPYVCSLGGFVVLEINKKGKVKALKPKIPAVTVKKFFDNSLFYYTGVVRESKQILVDQDEAKILDLKHKTKSLGRQILECFRKGDLDCFGRLMDEHWHIKKTMSNKMSSANFDEIYKVARRAGALGGKIMGAGGGGYFMFYCPTQRIKTKVRNALNRFRMREMDFKLDTKGARVYVVKP